MGKDLEGVGCGLVTLATFDRRLGNATKTSVRIRSNQIEIWAGNPLN